MTEWEIQRCKKEDKPDVYEFLKRAFFKHEPLTCDMSEVLPIEQLFAVKIIDQGHSYKAVTPNGRIVGIVINLNYPDLLKEDSETITTGRIQLVVDLFEYVGQHMKLNETGLLELFVVSVDPDYRRQGLARALSNVTLQHAENNGFTGVKIACTSKYSADLAETMGFRVVYTLAYADYKDESGKQILHPPAPHTHVVVMVKDLRDSKTSVQK